MKRKVVDTKAYVSILEELTEEGKTVSLLISGNSMSPFLVHERDYIFFRKPDSTLKKGDMVFFRRDTGEYVMHRICKVKDNQYFIVGDAQNVVEGPVRRDQIFAKIIRVERKGRQIGPGNFWWEFFEHIWINLIPFRRLLVCIYSVPRRILKKILHKEKK